MSDSVERPTGVLVVSVLALLLGVLGLIGAVTGCLGLAVGLFGGSMLTPPGTTPEMAAAQEAVRAAGLPMLPVNVTLLVLTGVLAVLLTVGGALVLASKPSGPRLLANTFSFGLVLEPLRAIGGFAGSVLVWDETRALTAVMSASQPTAPGMEGLVGNVATATMVISIVWLFLWTVVKVVIYAVGRRQLTREDAQEWVATLV